MLSVDSPADLAAHLGRPLGPGAWREVTEAEILAFARLSGDTHWTHTDAARVRRETSFGGLLAPGFMTLSLVTALAAGCWTARGATRWLNYGLDRVRFTHPVVAGDRLRAVVVLKEVAPAREGTRIRSEVTLEIEGRPRPALVADCIALAQA